MKNYFCLKKMKQMCFFLILLGGAIQPAFSQNKSNFQSTSVYNDGTVRFQMMAPKATDVKLNFQFIGRELPMKKDSNNLWSISVPNVEPDIYPYHFVVDGIRVADPKNSWIFPNEGFQNSLIEVPSKEGSSATIRDIPHGKVSYVYYRSNVTGMGLRPMLIYTPPGYENNPKEDYPVLFLLHGSSDTEETWTKVGRANIILDNLIYEKKAKPMIIAMPYGRCYPLIEKESGSIRNRDNLELFASDFINGIYPYVLNNYRVQKGANSHAIAGFSGGGGQALYIGTNNPNLMSWVCGFAPGMLESEFNQNNAVLFANPEAANKRIKLFWIGCGQDDPVYGPIKKYMTLLDEKKIKYEHFKSKGGHTWMNCRLFLTEISQKLFH